jgi:hypothetical protein
MAIRCLLPVVLFLLLSGVVRGQASRPAVKPGARSAAKAPATPPRKPYGKFTYTTYVVIDKAVGDGKPVPVRGVRGSLHLGPDGSYAKKFVLPGPQGPNYFNETGRYTLSGNKIEFKYVGSDTQPITYGGTFKFHPKAQALALLLNQKPNGSREVYGLVTKGSESRARRFDNAGNVTLK